MNKKVLIGAIPIIAVILAAVAAYAVIQPGADNETATDTGGIEQSNTAHKTPETTTQSTKTSQTATSTIIYTDNGFEPSSLMIKTGTTITLTNNSSINLTLGSADHPTHLENTELNLSSIKPGNSGTITVTRTGTWGYHNHDHATHTGKIVVTE